MPRVIAEDSPWVADGGITTSRGPVKFSLIEGVAVSEELDEEMAGHLSAIPGYKILTASRAKELFSIEEEETTPENTLESPELGEEEAPPAPEDPPSRPKAAKAPKKGKGKKR